MTIVQDELTEPVNAQDMARNYKQAYEKNDVQKMANKDVASAIAAKASPAFFFFISWLLHALCGFLQTIKQFDSEGSSDDEAKEKFLRNALSEGRKLNDQAGGSKEEQEAILIEVLKIVVRIVRDTEGNVCVSIVALKETILGVSQF